MESSDPAEGTPRLASSPGFSIGLGLYGALAVLSTRDATQPHAVAGLYSKARYSYFQLGAAIELSDSNEGDWRSIGGSLGGWLPYRNWVDLEGSIGLALRKYRNSQTRFGPNGYNVDTPALTLRLGFSDRSSDGLFGLRLGGELFANFDFKRTSRRWTYTLGEDTDNPRIITGKAQIGGVTLGLAMTAGFDVVPGQR